MIEFEEAVRRAEGYVAKQGHAAASIFSEFTIERPFGWVFFWGVRGTFMVGNSPVIVNRMSGVLSVTNTVYPALYFIEAYEALGQERFDAGEWLPFLRDKYREDDEPIE